MNDDDPAETIPPGPLTRRDLIDMVVAGMVRDGQLPVPEAKALQALSADIDASPEPARRRKLVTEALRLLAGEETE